MLSAESIATLRRVADVLLPETWEYFEALLDCVQVLCQEVRRASHKRNKELCEILDAFAFRITSEKREGRAAPEAWSLQFRSLFDRIYAHVDRCDRKTRWEVLLSRRHEKKQVTDFCIEITNLERAMKFSARSELLSGRSTSSESFATPRTNQERF